MVTKGDWAKRASGFRELFGQTPAVLVSNKSKLENIRKIRNEYAHGFGRKLDDVPTPTNQSPGLSSKLSVKTLLDFLNTVSRVAAGLDNFLLQNFIGNFELLLFYHQFRDKAVEGREKSYVVHRRLQRALNRDAALTVNAAFCKDLISYYESI